MKPCCASLVLVLLALLSAACSSDQLDVTGGPAGLPPVIDSLWPAQAEPQTFVILRGARLVGSDGQAALVTFGLNQGEVLAAHPNRLVILAPHTLVTGPVSVRVTTVDGGDSNLGLFGFGAPPCPSVPSLLSLSSEEGVPGGQLTLTGANLASSDGEPPLVIFGGAEASVVNVSAGSLVVSTPVLGESGQTVAVFVTTCGGTSFEVVPFTYL